MEDAMIVELFWQRSEEALRETQTKYDNLLKHIAYQILYDREDCKDAVNDTYLSAWNSIPPVRPQSLSAYLCRLVRQISIDIWRRRASKKRGSGEYEASLSELEECVADQCDPVKELEAKELSEAINRWLGGLSAENRDIFLYRYFYMDTLKEIAGYFRISEPRVKGLLFRMRQELKQYLEKEGLL